MSDGIGDGTPGTFIALVGRDEAADDHLAGGASALDPRHLQANTAVVDEHVVAGLQHLAEHGREDGQLAGGAVRARTADDDYLASALQIDGLLEVADAELGPLKVGDHGQGATELTLRLAHQRARSACSSRVPCEKLSLAASIPASASILMASAVEDAGPRVATIFVRRGTDASTTCKVAARAYGASGRLGLVRDPSEGFERVRATRCLARRSGGSWSAARASCCRLGARAGATAEPLPARERPRPRTRASRRCVRDHRAHGTAARSRRPDEPAAPRHPPWVLRACLLRRRGWELTTGSTFARYRIEALVGRGGMGVVYRATDLQLGRPVALKLISPDLAGEERFRARFLRESRVAASLDHPNVLPIYEAGEADGQLFIAMRYVDGKDLGALLADEGTLAPERALGIAAQVAAALDAAHDEGLVHRDVKPGNVLLDSSEHAYLTDFGLTKQLGGASTATGHVVGTFAYLAPEQIRGETVEGRTDGYALACVLYECLAGEPPFRRETEAETLWAHMQEEPPALPDYPALVPVWAKALAKTLDERYPTCRQLVDAAREALRTGAAGVATIMFTDVEGSTALTARLGDVAARELIEEQRRVVREEVARHGGRVIDSIGDGFMVAFESTRQSLLCALTVQERMAERGRESPERELRLRIGLNAGEVLERGGHPFGAAVNAAQRIAAAARGGQVVASDSVRQLAGTTPGLSFRDRGRVRLKGFDEPRRLYDVVAGEPVAGRQRLTRRRLAILGAVVMAGAGTAAATLFALGGDGAEGVGDALPVPPCGEVVSSSLSPDVLIASDLTLGDGETRAENQPLADAIRFALRRREYKAGDYTVGYQSCDNSIETPSPEAFAKKCAANARLYARTERLVAVIGNLYSGCAAAQIPILNRAPEGPLRDDQPRQHEAGADPGRLWGPKRVSRGSTTPRASAASSAWCRPTRFRVQPRWSSRTDCSCRASTSSRTGGRTARSWREPSAAQLGSSVCASRALAPGILMRLGTRALPRACTVRGPTALFSPARSPREEPASFVPCEPASAADSRSWAATDFTPSRSSSGRPGRRHAACS